MANFPPVIQKILQHISISLIFKSDCKEGNNLNELDCFLFLFDLNILPKKQSVHLYSRLACMFRSYFILNNKKALLFKCLLSIVSYLTLQLIPFIIENLINDSYDDTQRMERSKQASRSPKGHVLNQDSINVILQFLLYKSNHKCYVDDQKSSSSQLCRIDQSRTQLIAFPTIIQQKLQKTQNYRKIIEKSRQKIAIKPTSPQKTPFQPPNPIQNTLVIPPFQIVAIFIAVQYLLEMVKSSCKKETKSGKSVQSCTICMSRTVNCKTVDCSHEFCYRCLSKWTRRKGTCPMCRQDVRTILYKNKVIQPEFLKVFDEEKIVLSEQNRVAPALPPRPPRITLRPYLFVIPAFQNLAYLSTLNYYHYNYGLVLQ